MQRGQIKQVGNCWLLRYYEPVVEDGRKVMRQKTVKLTLKPPAISQKEQESAARAAADLILAPINAGTADPESRLGLTTFLEHVYLPHVKEEKRASTYGSYFQMWRLLKDHINGLELREVRTSDVDVLMKSATSDKKRAHTTHRNMRNFLRGAFRYAISRDMVSRNPVIDAKIPRGLPSRPKPAYTLEEIKTMIAVLPEPARNEDVLIGDIGGVEHSLDELLHLLWRSGLRADFGPCFSQNRSCSIMVNVESGGHSVREAT